MQAPEVIADIADDLEIACRAVAQAGTLALEHWQRGPLSWDKSDGSPVSEGDIAVNQLLHDTLGRERPDYGWLSEETPDDPARLARRRVWIADPIDGTRDFIAGGKDWCIALALLEDGRPILAIVSCPARDEVFIARHGEGAYRNRQRLTVRDGRRLAEANIVATRSVLARLGKAGGTGPRLALSLRLCRIAEGQSDAAVATTPKHDWDLAPGDLMVREAGGRVSTADGAPFLFNRRETRQAGLIAAPPRLHQDIVDRLRAT
ncbi:MAG: 3'(2'),5'-bisphosphate nucleotidase CysQ [Rhizobiales bacterium]|nr:3'(2'),5'-bisphosphate nucleotidase CysQ [Hyphomicrobiales bacterium]